MCACVRVRVCGAGWKGYGRAKANTEVLPPKVLPWPQRAWVLMDREGPKAVSDLRSLTRTAGWQFSLLKPL